MKTAVSYTHLDVYKRQGYGVPEPKGDGTIVSGSLIAENPRRPKMKAGRILYLYFCFYHNKNPFSHSTVSSSPITAPLKYSVFPLLSLSFRSLKSVTNPLPLLLRKP